MGPLNINNPEDCVREINNLMQKPLSNQKTSSNLNSLLSVIESKKNNIHTDVSVIKALENLQSHLIKMMEEPQGKPDYVPDKKSYNNILGRIKIIQSHFLLKKLEGGPQDVFNKVGQFSTPEVVNKMGTVTEQLAVKSDIAKINLVNEKQLPLGDLKLPKEELFALLKKYGDQLKCLYVRTRSFPEEDILELLKLCPNLEHITLASGFDSDLQIHDETLEQICRSYPKLQTLKLFECHRLTDASLANLSSLSVLETLDLSGCHNLSNAVLSSLSSLKSLNNLTINDCTELTDTGLTHISHLKELKTLNLSDLSLLGSCPCKHFLSD